jgi:trimethylamine:corrinoid methyltransferase-like protein
MCKFLDLPYAEAMTRFHEGRTRRKPGRSSKAQWLPPTAGLRDWRTQLSAEDVERIEVAVDDLLAELGYESRCDRCTPAARERVARIHEAFTAAALARDRVLPKGWEQ